MCGVRGFVEHYMIRKRRKKLRKNSQNELYSAINARMNEEVDCIRGESCHGNVPGDMVVVGLGLSLVCLKVEWFEGMGLKVWGLDLILGLSRIKFGIKVFG